LNIQHMKVADGALREGLLYDLLGRINNEDIRIRTAAVMAERYHVDKEHAERVRQTLRSLSQQAWPLGGVSAEAGQQWLDWAAELHEIGLDIAHSQYHKHGGYIIENADMPGFSRQDQLLLASLVRAHRRKLPAKQFKELSKPWHLAAQSMAILLRLAVLLNRARQPEPLPPIAILLRDDLLQLRFPSDWLAEHPLTVADLEQEAEYLRGAGIELNCA
jgi:exopolyphosphatase/guanosine-5'-triphosphate,3'-diphosphate pyrophosphatase